MDNIVCKKLKEEYDVCFNAWFCENFLKCKSDYSMCAPLLKAYQECVKKAVKEKAIPNADERQRYPWMFF